MSKSVTFVLMAMAVSIFSYTGTIHAQSRPNTSSTVLGGVGTGGGDECERLVRALQADFIKWIERKEYVDLELPKHFTLDQYAKEMKESLQSAIKISCPSRKEGEQSAVMVHGKPKTCAFDKRTQPTQVTCDIERLLKQTDEEGQYRLIHHEHAGLIGLEPPNEDESSYFVSDQISAHLTSVKRLSVKQPVQNLKLFLTFDPAKFIGANGKVIKTLTSNEIFKGVEEICDGKPCYRLEQLFNGTSWEPAVKSYLKDKVARPLEKRSVRLLTERNPVYSDFVLPAIVNAYPKETQLRGWHVSTVFGDFIFAEEILNAEKRWEKIEQPGYVRLPKY